MQYPTLTPINCLAVLLIGGYFFLPPDKSLPQTPVAEKPSEPPPSPNQPIPKQDLRQKLFPTSIPTLVVTPPAAEWTGWPALSLGGFAFVYRARFLRSAYRGWFGPVYPDRYGGFRCVRESRRQP